jgi:DNA polymerase III delta prime subunit
MKFVILDEVDYMTKNAQQALKYLLQSSCYNVRYCLICNYISKIDESLKNEFICIRFNQLPKKDIFKFINNIAKNENIDLSDEIIEKIQEVYNSDIRSIINFLQLNQNINNQNENNIILWKDKIISDDTWEIIHELLKKENNNDDWKITLNEISIKYNIDKKGILKNYFNYIIRKKPELISPEFLNIVETIMHTNNSNIYHILLFFILHMRNYFKSLSV